MAFCPPVGEDPQSLLRLPAPTQPAVGASSLHHLPDLQAGRGVSPLQDSAACPSNHLLGAKEGGMEGPEKVQDSPLSTLSRKAGSTLALTQTPRAPPSHKEEAGVHHQPLVPMEGSPTLWLPSVTGRSFSTASPPSPLAPQSGPKVANGDGELDFSEGGSGVSSFPPEKG